MFIRDNFCPIGLRVSTLKHEPILPFNFIYRSLGTMRRTDKQVSPFSRVIPTKVPEKQAFLISFVCLY